MTTPTSTRDDQPPLKYFRLHAGSTVIDLPFAPPPGALVRVATLWRDPGAPTGWADHPWAPGPAGRGFQPAATDLGDVIGFAAEIPRPTPELPQRRHRRPGRRSPEAAPPDNPPAIYWYGYLHAVTQLSVVLRGPYPTPHAAYAAAQAMLFAAIRIDHGDGVVPTEPAQPPAEVTVTWHGDTAVVGDPEHGWLHARHDAFTAALSQPVTSLADLLDGHVALTGREPVATLAALAAIHTPDQLGDITQRPPAGVSPLSPELDGPAGKSPAPPHGPGPPGDDEPPPPGPPEPTPLGPEIDLP